MAPKPVYETVNPEDGPLDRDGFIGVDPIYQNFANETDSPVPGESAPPGNGADLVAPEPAPEEEEPKVVTTTTEGDKSPKAPAAPAAPGK